MSDSTQTTELNEPITLKWSEALAVSWSLLWPSAVASVVLPGMIQAAFIQIPVNTFIAEKLILLAGLGFMASRLVHKDYRAFFVGVLKEGEPLKRALAVSEHLKISLHLLQPYIAFYVGMFLVQYWILFTFQTLEILDLLGALFLTLVVGPVSIGWVMHVDYRGFRLQAYRHKRKSDRAWSSMRSFRRNAALDDDQTEGDADSPVE